MQRALDQAAFPPSSHAAADSDPTLSSDPNGPTEHAAPSSESNDVAAGTRNPQPKRTRNTNSKRT